MKDLLKKALGDFKQVRYGELRFHERNVNNFSVSNGELDRANSQEYSGVGVRVYTGKSWGFSSTSRLNKESIQQAISDAIKSAKASDKETNEKEVDLAQTGLATGKYEVEAPDPVEDHSVAEKLDLVKKCDSDLRNSSEMFVSSSCTYKELIDHKIIVTTDGAEAEIYDTKPEFRLFGVASDGQDMIRVHESDGVTGGWNQLFEKKSPEKFVHLLSERAEKLMDASYPQGEKATVVLDPSLVGLISHEAIGHTVEADFVLSGAVTKGKLGQQVASELVTLVDSGPSQINPNASGTVIVDDEGVPTQKTVVIENGVLKSYLHSRKTASMFGVEPTGNARAYEFDDPPLIRMRNTYIQPGDAELDDMISDVDHGYYLKGAQGGQADANAEFMFGVGEAYEIKNGKLGEVYRGVTISGQAFDVLKSVDAVSKDFKWDMGAGYCGKGQRAKVDGGGPYIRCKAIIGGKQ